MRSIWSALLVTVFLTSCVHKPKHESVFGEEAKTSKAATGIKKSSDKSSTTEPAKTTGIVVDSKDVQILEKMTKAIEGYVLKGEKKPFTSICKDKRFDCFVDEVAYPKSKKKIVRVVPPYATGSKMGLQGEKRIQVKYDFYP